MTTVLVLAAAALWTGATLPRRRSMEPVDASLAGRLVLLGLRAGLSAHGALAEASRLAPPATAKAIRSAAHLAAVDGFDAAADRVDDLRSILRVIARAVDVGAPVTADLAAHLADVAREDHQRRLARAKSLPVRLAIPLTLLVLPGVVLLTVGPSLLGSLADLADPGSLLP